MRRIEEVLAGNAWDNSALFVFPSEVAARFWRRRILDLTGLPAFRSDRIISWDTFKEQAFPGPKEQRPVNTALRILFVRDLLKKNRENPFLRRLVSPGFVETAGAFSRSIRQLLPQLDRILEAIKETGAPLEEGLQEDLLGLRELYGDFLTVQGYYEPAFQEKPPARIDRQVYLFFPEVLHDYGDYQSQLEASDQVRILAIPEAEIPILEEYENSHQEIRGLMTRLAGLLDSGLSPEDMVVSFPGLEDLREDLEEQARIQGVPIRFRTGRSLAESPGGNFFAAAAGAVSSGFAVEDLKILLLDRAFPWKEEELIRRLIMLGLARSCLGSYRSEAGGIDPWQDALVRADQDIRTFVRDLRGALSRLVEAPDFGELQMQTQALASTFFDPQGWKPEALRAFQYALSVLADLAEMEKSTGPSLAAPFSCFLELLEDTIYVPRAEAGGVDIYPYRVAAGINPACHFIANASHESIEAVAPSLVFLREDQREALGLAEDEDMGFFPALYAASGKRVFFSYAGETRQSAVLPPSFFVSRDRVQKAADLAGERRADVFLRELAYWSGGEESPFSGGPLSYQGEGFRRFAWAHRAARGLDATREIFPAEAAGSLMERVAPRGRVRLSPSSLEVFARCPFQYLLDKVLGLEELGLEGSFNDPLLRGNLYHQAFAELILRIGEKDGIFRKEHLDSYRDLIAPLVEKIMEDFTRWDSYPPSAVIRAWREEMVQALEVFLNQEAASFNGSDTRGTEVSLEKEVEEASAVLNGRIDRVLGFPGEAGKIVVDYKTGELPTNKALKGEADEPAVQIPAYVYLLDTPEAPVSQALYYSVREGSYKRAFAREGKAVLGPEAMAQAQERLLGLIQEAADRVRQGDYRFYPQDCEACSFRMVCRRKYLGERRARG